MGALDTPVHVSFDQIRSDARNATYANSQQEAESVFEADQRVCEAVASHEERLIAQGEAHVDAGRTVFAGTDALVRDLLMLRGEMDNPGVRPTAALAKRYETLRRLAEAELTALQNVERSAMFQAEEVEGYFTFGARMRRKL